MGTPIEIEFAVNMSVPPNKPMEFGLLQMRPLVINREVKEMNVENVKPEELICHSMQALGNGVISDIYDIVFVDINKFERAKTREIGHENLPELDVEVLYPAALENAISRKNADKIKAKIICELANGPTTPEADIILSKKGVHVIPDILASAGGVTVSYLEMVQDKYSFFWEEDVVHKTLDQKLTKAYNSVHEAQKEKNVHPRLAAMVVGVARVAEACKLRGWV